MSVEERNREYAERAARDVRRKQELAFLGLTTREYHAVMQAGVNGVADFSMKSVLDLLKVQQVGKITVQGICKKLEVNGIRLSGPYFHELPEKQTPEQRCRAMDREVEALRADLVAADELLSQSRDRNAKLRKERDDLRAEVERMEKDRTSNASMAREMARDIMLVGESFGIPGEEQEGGIGEFLEAIATLRAERDSLRGEVELLRKDAERLTWLMEEGARVHGYLAQDGLRYGLVWPDESQQSDLFACQRAAIDAAMEVSR